MHSFIERPRFSCALSGALIAASALPETIPIVHSVAGCVGSVAWTQQGGSGLQVGGPCGCLSVPGTNLREREVVFGGADRLREQIANTLKVMEWRFFVVLTGCVSEVIGDDVDSVVREFQREGVSIVAARTGGFRGDSYRGYEELLKTLFRDYVQTAKRKSPRLVNLWGVVPGLDVFWRGNLEAMRRLLEDLRLKVNTFFTGQDSLENLASAGKAALNVVVSPLYGVEAAETFDEIHGTGYIVAPFPIGPTATERFLHAVAGAVDVDEKDVERVINRESERYYRYLSPLTDAWNDFDFQRYALVIGDANYAFALADFVSDDLGWLPEQVVLTDPLRDDQREDLLRRRSGVRSEPEHRLVFESNTSAILRRIDSRWLPVGDDPYRESFSPAFVIGSSMDRELAESLRAGHLSVSFPVSNRAVLDRTYVGYRGGLRLVEDLAGALVAAR
jgi:nitrogenase molybdenum-iron protein beta chain